MFDKDGSGTISNDELGTVMRSLGQNPSDQELTDLVEEVDIDGRDRCSKPEDSTNIVRVTILLLYQFSSHIMYKKTFLPFIRILGIACSLGNMLVTSK